ncbi:MAG: hypothetical protein WAV95_15025 [Azonexus sp.]
MMSEEMLKKMPQMMSAAGQMMAQPVAKGAALAAGGFAAGRSLLGFSLLRNPLTLLAAGVAAGVAAGFLAHKYQKEIIDGLSKASGMGKDFALHQKENLADLMAEATEAPAPKAADSDTPAA